MIDKDTKPGTLVGCYSACGLGMVLDFLEFVGQEDFSGNLLFDTSSKLRRAGLFDRTKVVKDSGLFFAQCEFKAGNQYVAREDFNGLMAGGPHKLMAGNS